MLKPVVLVSVSNVVGNGMAFLLMMIAGKLLPVDEFAGFSLAVSLCFMLTSVLDFGVNVTVVRAYASSRDAELFNGLMSVKCLTFVPVLLLGAGGIVLSADFNDSLAIGAWGLIGAGVLNLWMGNRAIEQARENFVRYAVNNLLYAAIRLVCGALVLLVSRDAAMLYFAAFVFPGLIFILTHQVFSGASRPSASGLRKIRAAGRDYAVWIFLSGSAYTALIYLPQFTIAQRLSNVAVSSYGIALSFLGVVALVANSVRTVLLPRLVGKPAGAVVPRFAGRLAGFLPLYIGGSAVLLAAGGWAIDRWYGAALPEAASVFLVCGAGMLATVYLGFFNVAIHAVGKPAVEACSNLARLLVLMLALWAWGDSLMQVAGIFATVLVAGELATAAFVASLLRRQV